MSTVSRLNSLDQHLCLCCFYCVNSFHFFFLFIFSLLYFPALFLFQRSLPSQDMFEVEELCYFCFQQCLSCSKTYLCSFNIFQMNTFFNFLPVVFTVQLLHPYIIIGNMRVWMILALELWSFFLVTFLSFSIVALSTLEFLVIATI